MFVPLVKNATPLWNVNTNLIMSTEPNYLPNVKKQYEELPYPPRDPEDEKKRFIHTPLEVLEVLNHLGFKGKQDYTNNFRCLVAGGGTGDSTIYLAERLKNIPNAEVVQVDLSNASLNICKERAKVRGLTNIKWIQGSLLDLANIDDIGKFDYINCSGVLHHLESPADGLNSLNSVLKDDGIMGIMVYAKYGRLNIYPLQQVMRYVNQNAGSKQEELDNTKKILKELPDKHFANMNDWINTEYALFGDSGLYDLLLHSQDRAYTVPELYDWVEGCNLNLVAFNSCEKNFREYKPESHIPDKNMLKKIKELPLKKQQAVAEIMNGKIYKHLFYVSKKMPNDCIASTKDKKLVPFFLSEDMNVHIAISQNMQSRLSEGSIILTQKEIKTVLPATKESVEIVRLIDGTNSISTIIKKAEKKLKKKGVRTNTQKITATFEIIFERLNETVNMFLRDKNIKEFEKTI